MNNRNPFESIFTNKENIALWFNIVKYLNGVELIQLARSHSSLLAFYLKYRLLLWKELASNEFHISRLCYPIDKKTDKIDEDEWIYWKKLYMKMYDFRNRVRWKEMANYRRHVIYHKLLSISPMEYNPVVVTRLLPKFVPILDLEEESNGLPAIDTPIVENNVSKQRRRVGTKLEKLTLEERKMRNLLINRDKYAVISLYCSAAFYVFNLDKERIEKTFYGHHGIVNDVDIMCTDPYWISRNSGAMGQGTFLTNTLSTSFNNRLISASSDATLKIWDLMSTNCLATLTDGHNGCVYCVKCTNDYSKAISSGYDGSIAIWDCHQGVLIDKGIQHTYVAYCVRIDPYCQFCAVSCGRDGYANVYDIRKGCNAIQKFYHLDNSNQTSPVYCVDICNQYVVTGTKGGDLSVWDMRMSNNMLQKISHPNTLDRVQIDEVKCVASCSSGELYFYEINHCHDARPSAIEEFLNGSPIEALSAKVLNLFGKQDIPSLSSFSLELGGSISFDTDLLLTGNIKSGIILLLPTKKI
jgi:WD40 repeat protein